MQPGAEYICLDCGKISTPQIRLQFMTEIECMDCFQKKRSKQQEKRSIYPEIFDIVESLGNTIVASTQEARDTLRLALENYARTYPAAYQYIHADNPFLSVLLTMLEAQTKAVIKKPDE